MLSCLHERIVEFEKRVTELIRLRPYLSSTEIHEHITELTQEDIYSPFYWIEVCIMRARRGQNMPWEKEDE